MRVTLAKVVVLAGPSGAGKSRLAERLGLPVLHLDDFYKEATDPSLPVTADGSMVDWDNPTSWSQACAVGALQLLCTEGSAVVPVYDISLSARVGQRDVDLAGARLFVAEGIFAPEVVADCERLGILAAAHCITQHPLLTFWRRLTRDLREQRKPPTILVRRGIALLRDQRRVVANALAKGCRRATPEQAYAQVRALQ